MRYESYDDIIDLPRFVSKKHPAMSKTARAAQFSPFAALTGFDDEITETARLTDCKAELSEEQQNKLNSALMFLQDNIRDRPLIRIEYFIKDKYKEGGAYVIFSGNIKRIQAVEKQLVFTDGTVIDFDDVYSIEIP